MKKRFLAVLLALMLVFAISIPAFAKAPPQDPYWKNAPSAQPRWVYQFEHTSTRSVGMNEELGNSMYVELQSGYDTPDGEPILAKGNLYLIGTAYGFPTAGEKTGTYRGIVTAYIND